MEKKNNNILAWVALVVAVFALVAIYFNSGPELAPSVSGKFKVEKVANTDPNTNCYKACELRDSKSFCVGSGYDQGITLHTYTISSIGGACGGTTALSFDLMLMQ